MKKEIKYSLFALLALAATGVTAEISDQLRFETKVIKDISNDKTCICTGCPDELAGAPGTLRYTITNNYPSRAYCAIPVFDRFGHKISEQQCSDYIVIPH